MYCELYNSALVYLESTGYEVIERDWKFTSKVIETSKLKAQEKDFLKKIRSNQTETQKMFIEKLAADPKDPDYTVLMMNIFRKKNNPDGKRYLLFFCQKKQYISNHDVRQFFSIVTNLNLFGGFFVYHGMMKKLAEKIFTGMNMMTGYTIIVKSFHQLILFSLKNDWCPKVIRIEEKGKEFLEKNGISVIDCPKIHSDDLTVISNNAKSGSVLVLENKVLLPGVLIKRVINYSYVL